MLSVGASFLVQIYNVWVIIGLCLSFLGGFFDWGNRF